jgi:type 2 lantibiotic biosynthesis protein LanM
MRAGGICDYFSDRPVLARLVATVTGQWVETTAEIVERLTADAESIFTTLVPSAGPAPVTDVECDLSDPHDGGRTVCAITFAGGHKILYKPRDLGLDEAWISLLKWLRQEGAPLVQRGPAVLARDGYGWVEWVEAEPPQDEHEAQEYFSAAGAALCILYILQATDFHYENVLPNRRQPVLVDLETLMHPWFVDSHHADDPKSAVVVAGRYLRDSVVATGYLPNWVAVPGARIVDVGGLNLAASTDFARWSFCDVNSDGMRYERPSEQKTSEVGLSNPEKEPPLSAIYENEICKGFEQMFRFLINNRAGLVSSGGPLTAFKGKRVRVLIRPTQLYTLILRRSLENTNLSSGIDWSLHFGLLSRYHTADEDEDTLSRLEAAERLSLTQLNIPRITSRTDSDVIEPERSCALSGLLDGSGYQRVLERAHKIGQSDLQRQLGFIRQALRADPVRSHAPQFEPWDSEQPEQKNSARFSRQMAVDRARSLAQTLRREAILSGEGAAWLGLLPISEEHAQLDVIGNDLYSGATGIALFLAALSRVTGDDYRALSLAAIAPLREELWGAKSGRRLALKMGIGGAAGLGSVVYALVLLSRFLENDELLEDATRAAELIGEEKIAADRKLDVIAGAAGAILGLLPLYETRGEDFVLERAVACGRRLLATQDPALGAWRTIGDVPLTGFAHGAAGIAYALIRLYRDDRDPATLEAALKAIRYERSCFVPDAANWMDLRVKKSVRVQTCQWCHGAAGIGLARVGALEMLNDEQVLREVDIALKTTLGTEMQFLDSLCCGNLGRLEFLFTAGLRLNRQEIVDVARSRAARLVESAGAGFGFRWLSGADSQNLGFFNGVSGAGYELLRMAYPETLPSVLLWETPQKLVGQSKAQPDR